MISINKQLRKYFVIIVLCSIMIITLFSNIGISYFFKNYVEKSKIDEDKKIINYINEYFSPQELYNNNFISNVVLLSRTENVIIIIKSNEKIILDTSQFHMMGKGMGRGMMRNQNEFKNMDFNEYKLFDKTNITIDIGRVSSVLFSKDDEKFIYTINGIFLVAFIISLILSILISSFVSKKFLKPLLLIKSNVSLISKEQYSKLNTIETNTYELKKLSDSINELAERIQNQELLRKRLTSDIAHELRTPLATLQTLLEAFVDGVIKPTTQKLSSCYDEIIRLSKLVNDLADLSKIENNEVKIDFKKLEVDTILRNVVENFKPMFESKNISLIEDIQKNIIIFGDKDRLSQVFINILSNSYKYTQNNGQIRIITEVNDNEAIITIEDSGEGIDEKDLPYIFERFYRGDISRSRLSGGTGIGLTIAKAIIESHNGNIQIQSEKGKGTKVIIVFPLNLQ